MMTVQQLLEHKGSDVWTIGPDASVRDGIKLMDERRVGALPVVKGTKLLGLFSVRDYMRTVIRNGKGKHKAHIKDVMTRRVCHVSPDRTIEDARAIMAEKNVRHLPVLSGRQLVGVISARDVQKATIAEKDFIIEQFEKYITGSMG